MIIIELTTTDGTRIEYNFILELYMYFKDGVVTIKKELEILETLTIPLCAVWELKALHYQFT